MAPRVLVDVLPLLPSPLSNFDISPLFASLNERTRAAARGKVGLKISQSRNSPTSEDGGGDRRDGRREEVTHSTLHSVRFRTQRSLLNFRIVKV